VQNVQKVPLRNPFKIKWIRFITHGYFNTISEFLPIVNVVCETVAAALSCHRFLAFLAQCPRSCAKRPDFGSVSHMAVLYSINGGYANIKMASDTANAAAFLGYWQIVTRKLARLYL
jgi:hypothetical protein